MEQDWVHLGPILAIHQDPVIPIRTIEVSLLTIVGVVHATYLKDIQIVANPRVI